MSLLGKAIRAVSSSNTASATPPIPYARTGYSPPSLTQGGNDPAGYMRAYGANGTLFSIVSMLARQTAKKDWHLYRQAPQDGRVRYTTGDKGSDQRVEVLQHWAMSLWNKPNRFTTGFQFRELGQTYLDLTGEDYIVIGRDARANLPMSLWQVRPDRMDPVPSREEYLLGYVYTGPSGEQIPLQLDEVIQIKYPNPFDPFRGLGPVQSILVDIDSAKYSAQWNRNFFLNSATPGGVIQVDKRLTDEEWNEFSDRWRESHRGMGAAHRVAVLEQGAQWVANAHTIQDMDFANLRNVSRDVIREAFAMHKAIMGTTDDVNRANAQTAQEHFESFLITDRLDRWKDTLNCFYLPLFGSTGSGVEMDHDDAVTSNREADALELKSKAEAAASLVTAGYDPHDVLETVGLPDMEVAEKATQEPAVPPGWVLTPPATPGAPEAPDDEPGAGAPPQNRHRRRLRAADPQQPNTPQPPNQNLDAVDAHWKEAVAVLAAAWMAQIVPNLRAQLTDKISALVDAGDLAGLANLAVDTTEGATLLTASLTGMASTAAKQAAAEASAQGATAPAQPAPSDTLKRIAEATAALQGAQLALSAGAEAARIAGGGNRTGHEVAAQTDTFMAGLTDTYHTSRLPGALSAAQNESRIATFLGGDSADLFASEVNDTNTCDPCAAVDGQYIGNTADPDINAAIDVLYPNGGYIGCEGRDRCRGSVVASYPAAERDEDHNEPDPVAASGLPFFLVNQHLKPLKANGHNHHEKAGVTA